MRLACLILTAAMLSASAPGCATISIEEKNQLEARLKEVENRQSTVEDQAEARRERTEQRFAELEQAISELRAATTDGASHDEILQRIAALEKSVGKLSAKPGAPAGAAPAGTPAVEAPKQPTELEKARALLNEGKTKEARTILQKLDQTALPKEIGRLITLLVGESFFQEKNYHEAILSFHKVVEATPASAETPQAMLREAQSFALLGKQENAAFLFRKLLSDYPDSEQADEVPKELAKVK